MSDKEDMRRTRNNMAKSQRYSGKKMLSVYLEPDLADQFVAFARSQDQSTASLLYRIISHVLGRRRDQQHSGEESEKEFSESKKKTHSLTVCLTDGEAERLLAEADRHEMRPSPFIRLILRGALTKGVSFSEVEHDEIRKLRTELTKIGTNLNQAVKLLKANPYGENILTTKDIEKLRQVLNEERAKLGKLLEENLTSWANIYPR